MRKICCLCSHKFLLTKLLRLILLFSWGLLIVLSSNWQPLWAKIDTPKLRNTAEYHHLLQSERSVISKLPNIKLLQPGQQLYQDGQFSAAIKMWQQAVNSYVARGEKLDQSLAWGYLASAWKQLGEWQLAEKAMTTAFNLLESAETQSDRNTLPIRARLLDIRGQLQLSQGKKVAALSSWQDSEAIYRKLTNLEAIIDSKINQSRALHTLGLYSSAQKTLKSVGETITTQPDSLLKVAALSNLGKAYGDLGDLATSQQVLERSLTISEKLARTSSHQTPKISSLQSHALLSLGNIARVRKDAQQALAYYQQGTAIAVIPVHKISFQVNQLSLLVDTQQWQPAQTLWQEIKAVLTQLPVNRQTIEARINIAHSLIEMRQNTAANLSVDEADIRQLLDEAITQARNLEDRRSQSTAIGSLGYWYEQNQQWNQARQFTQQALTLAQAHQLPAITYRWQWQLGRLFQAQGDRQTAIALYQEAVNSLQLLQPDLVVMDTDIQFSFPEQVEPVYRQLVELLLQHSPQETISQQNLQQARQTIESLQQAELENFFQEAYLTVQPNEIDQLNPQTAVIYPIILPDKLAVILALPQHPLHYYETALAESATEQLLDRMRQSLRQTSFAQERLPIAQQVYDLLIRPAETQLANSQVDTLVFVLDGILRTLPMSVLYDGDRYLIEKYNIALAPGLQLLDTRSLKRGSFEGLIGALSEARQGFSALPGVIEEIKQVSSQIFTQVLLNRDFTRSSIHQEVQHSTFPVVHLATHGQFSSSAEETFILAWDGQIKVKELAQWLEFRGSGSANPIELLVLSACETAAGDRRAALGMAGVAVRSGVRSTVASLWSVQDNSTAILMTKFYQELTHTESSKAEALRRAQLKLLNQTQYQHPYYWASFVLIGNWL